MNQKDALDVLGIRYTYSEEHGYIYIPLQKIELWGDSWPAT